MQSLHHCLWAQKDLNSVPVTVNVMEWDKEELSGCAAENINSPAQPLYMKSEQHYYGGTES